MKPSPSESDPAPTAAADPSQEGMQRLRAVVDPELGVNIVDLGLVESLSFSEQGLHLRMTLTSAACPMAESLLDEVDAALLPLLQAHQMLNLELVFDPPWTPERMSAAARERLGWSPEP